MFGVTRFRFLFSAHFHIYLPLRTEVVGSAISAICLSMASSCLVALLTPPELRPPQHVHSLLILKQPPQNLVATFPFV